MRGHAPLGQVPDLGPRAQRNPRGAHDRQAEVDPHRIVGVGDQGQLGLDQPPGELGVVAGRERIDPPQGALLVEKSSATNWFALASNQACVAGSLRRCLSG
jgi:hypothetical protein